MSDGVVEGIYITSEPNAQLHEVAQVRAMPGRGLEGDRYSKPGALIKRGVLDPAKEITLIEREAIEAVARDKAIAIKPGESRRNIETRGVPLNHLVGKEFTVGQVRMRGIKLCEPCGHLEGLTCKGTREAFIHRGGLRAQILTEGVIRVGDSITVPQAARLREPATVQ